MKFSVLCTQVVAAILLLSTAVVAQDHKRPNIIVILVDDLGWGDVGYHGSQIRTPYLDKFAREGIELDRFYTAAVCSPTRAGLMTGRYPDRFGLRTTVIPPWSKFGVDLDEVYLPQVLATAGYKNRAVYGKWHLGHANKAYHPLNRGFTHFYGHLNGAIDFFSHEREGELDWHNGFQTSRDQGYSTDLIAEAAINDLKKYVKEGPFFQYIAFNAPHSPLQAKESDLLKYGYDKSKPPFGQDKEGQQGRGNTREQTYSAMVTNLDENIGRILATLKALNIEKNTLILFHSDNGAAPGEGGSSGKLRGTKFTEWEGGLRAPAIIRWPEGFKQSGKNAQLMGYIDVMPTILDILGVPQPTAKPLDGISMYPVLSGKVERIPRNFFLGSGAIMNQDWKLIEASDLNPRMELKEDVLFNISKDETETRNLATQNLKEYQELKDAIKKYNAIKSSSVVPPFGEGRKGFKAPREWKITE